MDLANVDTAAPNGGTVHNNYGTIYNLSFVVNICTGGEQPDEDNDDGHGAASMLVRLLGAIGVFTESIATGATVYNRPRGFVVAHGGELAYLLGTGVLFVAGLAEVGAALWVCRDGRGRLAAGKKIMCASLALLALAVVLGCFAIMLKK